MNSFVKSFISAKWTNKIKWAGPLLTLPEQIVKLKLAVKKSLAYNFCVLGARKGQIGHQSLVAKDKTDNRILDICGINRP